MGKCVRAHISLGLLLQRVITNGAGCRQPLLYIPRFEQLAGAVGMMGPDASKAIRLQFLSNGQFVAFRPAQFSAGRMYLAGDARQGLDMVANLVGNDIRLGKVSRLIPAPGIATRFLVFWYRP